VNAVTSRQIPLLDLQAQYTPIRGEIQAAMERVIASQRFIMGDDVKQLELEIARYCGARFAIGCASGSDALFLALLALGIGPGDKVLTTPYTFFATVGAIHRAGAVPVFADIDPLTFNIDPQQVASVLDRHSGVKAIIPVHLFGACAQMEAIVPLARSRGISVIEDAAQAIGAEMNDRRAGVLGDVACFSFFPSKNLGCFGDGGILTTDDPELAERLSILRVHGAKKKYFHQLVGINSRLDSLQAAIVRVKLKHLDQWTEGRQRNADFYNRRLVELGIPITLPAAHGSTTRHIYNQYVICGDRRDELQTFLKDRGIGTEVYYPLPMHLQECFAHLGYRQGDFPASENRAAASLAIPIYAELTQDDLEAVCQAVKEFYSG